MLKFRNLFIVLLSALLMVSIVGCSNNNEQSNSTNSANLNAEESIGENTQLSGIYKLVDVEFDDEVAKAVYPDESDRNYVKWLLKDETWLDMIRGSYIEFCDDGEVKTHYFNDANEKQEGRYGESTEENGKTLISTNNGDSSVIVETIGNSKISISPNSCDSPSKFVYEKSDISNSEDIVLGQLPNGEIYKPSINVIRNGEESAILDMNVKQDDNGAVIDDSALIDVKIDTSIVSEKFDETKPVIFIEHLKDYPNGVAVSVENLVVDGDIWTVSGYCTNDPNEYGSLVKYN